MKTLLLQDDDDAEGLPQDDNNTQNEPEDNAKQPAHYIDLGTLIEKNYHIVICSILVTPAMNHQAPQKVKEGQQAVKGCKQGQKSGRTESQNIGN